MSPTGRNHDTTQVLNERLQAITGEFRRAERELERYHAALQKIADAKSGVWGRIAHDALHPPSRAPPDP